MSCLAEIIRLKGQISKIDKTLADEKFISKAPENVITLNKKKLSDFEASLKRVIDECLKDLDGIKSKQLVPYFIEYEREKKYLNDKKITLNECLFDNEYFSYVYNQTITDEEYCELHEVFVRMDLIISRYK